MFDTLTYEIELHSVWDVMSFSDSKSIIGTSRWIGCGTMEGLAWGVFSSHVYPLLALLYASLTLSINHQPPCEIWWQSVDTTDLRSSVLQSLPKSVSARLQLTNDLTHGLDSDKAGDMSEVRDLRSDGHVKCIILFYFYNIGTSKTSLSLSCSKIWRRCKILGCIIIFLGRYRYPSQMEGSSQEEVHYLSKTFGFRVLAVF